MNRIENLDFCIQYLSEQAHISPLPLQTLSDRKKALRALMNVWEPRPLSEPFLAAQDHELQTQLTEKGIVTLAEIPPLNTFPMQDGDTLDSQLFLWQGDITRLQVDAIVNAANSGMLGCWSPLHNCIDNCIHSSAGLQLRSECSHLVQTGKWRGEESAAKGEVVITQGYNLPARHVIHTVGPIVPGSEPTSRHRDMLERCYRSCLEMAARHGCTSIAFCCISTGVFGYPNREASRVAVATVLDWLHSSKTPINIVFNVFKDIDYQLYQQQLAMP